MFKIIYKREQGHIVALNTRSLKLAEVIYRSLTKKNEEVALIDTESSKVIKYYLKGVFE